MYIIIYKQSERPELHVDYYVYGEHHVVIMLTFVALNSLKKNMVYHDHHDIVIITIRVI